MRRLLLLFIFLSVSLFGSDKVFILPKDSDKAYEYLEKKIKKSSSTIDIAVYNFEYKKIAKLLKKVAKDGVNVNILFEKNKLENKKSKYDYLCESKNINCKVYKKAKQHIKLMIFDNQIAMFGSANLTKESFNSNLELIYFTDDKDIVNKLHQKFTELID